MVKITRSTTLESHSPCPHAEDEEWCLIGFQGIGTENLHRNLPGVLQAGTRPRWLSGWHTSTQRAIGSLTPPRQSPGY